MVILITGGAGYIGSVCVELCSLCVHCRGPLRVDNRHHGVGIGNPLSKYFPSIALICFGAVRSFYTSHGYKPSFLRRQERELEIIVKSATVSLLLVFAVNFAIFKSVGFSRYIYLFV